MYTNPSSLLKALGPKDGVGAGAGSDRMYCSDQDPQSVYGIFIAYRRPASATEVLLKRGVG